MKGFYIHLISYVCVNSFFIIITLFSSPGNYWFVLPLIGWGIGLLADASNTFNVIPFLSKDWENRKIKQYMEEEQNTFLNHNNK